MTCVARLDRFGGRSSIWRTTSAEAAVKVADASLDLVHLGASVERSVGADRARWFPKVRGGGFLAGDAPASGAEAGSIPTSRRSANDSSWSST